MQEENNEKICLRDNSQKSLLGMPDEYDFSKYETIKEYSFDRDLFAKFAPIAKKLNLSQNCVDTLLDLALEMSKRQNEYWLKDENEKLKIKIDEYSNLMQKDCDIPYRNSVAFREYMEIADNAYTFFCSDSLKELFESLGLICHPELIKMFHKIGELAQEENVYNQGLPPVEELTPAQILYGKKEQ